MRKGCFRTTSPEDGFLFINGRVKNLIILSNGENISPEEIENKLALDKLVYMIACSIGSTIGVLHKWSREDFQAPAEVVADILRIVLSSMADTRAGTFS